MASDDIYILGINMTKFGKHPDKDTVDLAAEAAMGAGYSNSALFRFSEPVQSSVGGRPASPGVRQ